MMDRLTEWTGLGAIATKYAEDFDMTEETYRGYQNILDKLAHYEDLEEAGRLVELPCAVGDTVYIVQYENCNDGNCPWFDDEIGCIKGGIESAYCPQDIFEFEFSLEDLGRKIYLTHEEAEAALKERESE